MRAINSARLYSSGHDILNKHIAELHGKFKGALGDLDFLFLGCARNVLYFEGTFYKPKEPHVQKFLTFFHFLRISQILLEKELTAEELGLFIELLAGARQGQGDEVLSALTRDNTDHVRIGLLDYTVFSAVQTAAAQLTAVSDEAGVWRQLILQPAGAGTVRLDQAQTNKLASICGDVEQLKKLLSQLDSEMKDETKGVSVTQRGTLLGNFIQNIGDLLSGMAPIKRKLFSQQLITVLDTLEPGLRAEILGSIAPEDVRGPDNDVIHEIIQALPDAQLTRLLGEAVKESGVKSRSFNNLFGRALAKYREPGVLLTLIQQEMHRTIEQGESEPLGNLQQLEQLLIQKQESEEVNKQYHQEIDALATSIQMQMPVKEEEEIARLLKTLTPEELKHAKAKLIVDLIGQAQVGRSETVLPSLLESLGETLRSYLSEGAYLTVGNTLRAVYLTLGDHPKEELVRNTMNAVFTGEQIHELLDQLLRKCHTFEPRETSVVDAICQLYQDKAGALLLDRLREAKDDDSPQVTWISTTLATLGPGLGTLLTSRLRDASNRMLPRLLTLVAISKDAELAPFVKKLLDHKNQDIRLKAIATIGHLRAERMVPRLTEIALKKTLLKTKKLKDQQIAAVKALAEIGTDEAREALQQVADKGSGELRKLCGELL
ncbi:MAG: HEAT repeat domain-containing protein [Deltaproteobacteria bacterium]|nr:HEAT repeat domain-containing protein [Deltaproteobacteria bacterium]